MHADDPRDELDALIDDVAQAMTAGNPPLSLRESVGAALSPRRRFALRGWQLAGAAVLIVLAIAGTLRQAASWIEEEPPSTAYVARAADIPIPPEVSAPETRIEVPEPPVRRRGGRSVTPLAGMATAAIVIEPIEDLEPIAPATVAVDTIPQPMPLTVAPVAVEPLILE